VVGRFLHDDDEKATALVSAFSGYISYVDNFSGGADDGARRHKDVLLEGFRIIDIGDNKSGLFWYK
jgi:hypothetical protein